MSVTRCKDTGCHQFKACLRSDPPTRARRYQPEFKASPRRGRSCHAFVQMPEDNENMESEDATIFHHIT